MITQDMYAVMTSYLYERLIKKKSKNITSNIRELMSAHDRK